MRAARQHGMKARRRAWVQSLFTNQKENHQMSLTNPNIGSTDGKFSETVGENVPFVLHGIETVENVQTQGYGQGTMVVIDCEPEGKPRGRYGIWGDYLVKQAESVEPSDLGKVYQVVRGPIEGFSQRPDTKRLEPVR